MLIQRLQSVVSREQAMRKLSPPGAAGFFRHLTTGKLMGMAEIYIPYRLSKILVEDRGEWITRFLAVDLVAGRLDPLELTKQTLQDQSINIETRNHLPVMLSDPEAHSVTLAKTRKLLFSTGLFRLSQPSLFIETVVPEFYVPYWIGFLGQENNVKILAINATRSTLEGSKVAECIQSWLADRNNPTAHPA
ncbi:MAG TPA: hypothetical protein VFB79_23205 [Candidatus Angelobacter sp.]|nr:hypothetical protein [Candidatus Angelobacter sp.]